ncbi:MAG: dihydroorotate dehydrogenase-like protein [bacterium]
MADIKTKYLGLELSSPVIVGSSGLTSSLENLKKIEAAGAGAVVLKSLFEEQIIEERIKSVATDSYMFQHPESMEYISQMSMNFGPDSYLSLIREAKKELSIPIIASVNCVTEEYWIEFAKKIEAAGADAMELNISHVAHDVEKSADLVTDDHLSIFRAVKEAIGIPVSIKMGQNFTNVARMVKLFENFGAEGVVLFNRFYQVDIDIEKLKLIPGQVRSSKHDITETIRWVSIISGKTKLSIAGSRGVFDGKDAVKMLLAGADAVQTVSSIYQNGIDYIAKMNFEIKEWMERKNFNSLNDFKGILNQKNIADPENWERQQYIKAIVGIE